MAPGCTCHLSGHAGGPRAATGDTTSVGQTQAGRQKVNESARRQPENQPLASDDTAPTRRTLTVRNSRVVRGAFDANLNDFGRPIGRGSVAEGLRAVPVRPGSAGTGADRRGVAGFARAWSPSGWSTSVRER